MNEREHIEQLIEKLLDNTISEIEFNRLLGFVKRNESEGYVKYLMDIHWERIRNHEEVGEREKGTSRFSKILNAIDEGEVLQQKEISKTISFDRYKYWKIGIAAASIFIMVLAGLYGVKFSQNNVEEKLPLVSDHFTGKQFLRLPDGSSAILNEGSELEYGDSYGINDREIWFSGEGYFDIVRDTTRPFIVRTGDVKTTVLGTAFNVTAYGDEPDVIVTVEHGKVAVGDDMNEYEKIKPEQQLIVNKETKEFKKLKVDLNQTLAWKSEFLILDGLTVQKAVEVVGKRYGATITLENKGIENCEINAAFMKGESLVQVLRVICGVLQADYEIDNNSVVISGGRICERRENNKLNNK